jgi:hypothetical protein
LATAAQLKQITRPLLEIDPRFVLLKRWLIIRPVGHWLYGYHLDRRTEKGVFVVRVFIKPLHTKDWRESAWEVYPPPSAGETGTWSAITPNVDRHLIEVMAGDASNALTRVDSPDMFLALLLSGWHPHTGDMAIHTFALAGRRREAIHVAESWLRYYRNPPDRRPRFEKIRRLQRLIAVFKAGQARTNRLLRTFEWINARKHGVEQWWSWTPIAT